MPRYKLTIAYDGTDFCGWQKQFPHADAVPGALTKFRADDPPVVGFGGVEGEPACAEGRDGALADDCATNEEDDRPRAELRTVQAVVERAVRLVVRQPVTVMGASRTDSGVHARGQVCAFSTAEGGNALPEEGGSDNGEGRTNFERFGGGWPAERGCDALVRALNARLPADVICRSAEVVADDFDPISGAKRKAYSYTIWNSTQRALWDRRNALHVWHALDVRRMNEAAQALVGEHDFAGFAAAGHGRLTTVRTVYSCAVRAERVVSAGQVAMSGEVAAQRIVIDVSGNGFLWNMVRIIAGTLMEAGKGKIGPERIAEALRTGDRNLAGPTAPAHGLCLEWIRYA
ncbi:MAG: tRNA pseudouridine synthase A [Phycisphaeraceae bacterium]|nr:tRNA pseudouridine synthase A [Phycisphaeraceae bacterium]